MILALLQAILAVSVIVCISAAFLEYRQKRPDIGYVVGLLVLSFVCSLLFALLRAIS